MRPADDSRGVTCPFGKKGSSWATGEHGGIDYGTPTGDPVYAMWGGTITGASWGSAYGTHLVIDHDHLPDGDPGLWAVYAHLSKKVRTSGRVEAGELIGYSGATGNVSGPHLHVEVQRAAGWKQGNYVDPQPWVDAIEEGQMSDYWYSGKPSGTLSVGQSYVNLDIEEWDPPSGVEDVLVYLNCSSFVFDGGRPGRIRVCFERDPNNSDRFGYQDFVVVPGIPELLITHSTFEKGDGTRTWTQMKCMDGLQSMKVGTRYQKRTVR